jgi:hypothetical protein
MAKERRIVCEYCKTSNPRDAGACLACGGPLVRPKVDLEPKVTTVQSSEEPEQIQSEDIQKAAEKADDLYFMAWNTYAIAWRTVGEAIAIALTGFILGFVGGATESIFPGILGATLVGLAVGVTRKQFYIVLISAPAGLLLGLGFGAAIWFLGGVPQVMVYTGLVFAITGAFIGGRRSLPFKHRNCWEKSRPFLGALGGFVFGILGSLIGWGIVAGIQSLLAL